MLNKKKESLNPEYYSKKGRWVLLMEVCQLINIEEIV